MGAMRCLIKGLTSLLLGAYLPFCYGELIHMQILRKWTKSNARVQFTITSQSYDFINEYSKTIFFDKSPSMMK